MLMLQDVIRTRKPGCDTCYPEYMESARKCMLFVKILLLHFLSCANIELQTTLSFHLGSPSVLIKMPLFGIVSTSYSIIELHEYIKLSTTILTTTIASRKKGPSILH